MDLHERNIAGDRLSWNEHKKRLGIKAKSKALAKKKGGSWEEAKKKTYGIHQLGLKDEPRHKTLEGKEVKY